MLKRMRSYSVRIDSLGYIRTLTKYKDVFLRTYNIPLETLHPCSGLRASLIVAFLSVVIVGCNNNSSSNNEQGPSPALTPSEELATFQLSAGLKIQLVASEPMVQDPVVNIRS